MSRILEKKMNKTKSKFLFTLICVLLAVLITMTFIRFTVGITDYNSIIGAISLDYDIGGGYSYEVALADDNEEEIKEKDVMDILCKRLDYVGFKGYTVKAIKSTDNNASASELRSRYVIAVPASLNDYGKDDVTSLTNTIEAVLRYGEVEVYYGTQTDTTNKIEIDGEFFDQVKYLGEQSSVYMVSARFTKAGWDAIENAESTATETFYIKITLGDEVLVNGSFSSSDFSDRTIYLQDGTESGARQKALQIALGGLSYKFNVNDIEAVKINPLLGKNTATLIVVIVGLIALAIIVATFVICKGLGVVAMISVLAFIFTVIAMLVAVPGIVLSVAGVIGILATLLLTGINLFATVKRVGFEYASGKTVRSAVKTAFNSMFRSVLNACVVAGIIAIALLIFTTGTMYTLGATLGIGTVVSFVATTLLARLIANCMVSFTENPEVVFALKRTEE